MATQRRQRRNMPSKQRVLKRVQRNHLISALLQDRGVVRLISAPHGFGKTTLAREYAERMFGDGRVSWLDARSPDFLLALDAGALPSVPTCTGKAMAAAKSPEDAAGPPKDAGANTEQAKNAGDVAGLDASTGDAAELAEGTGGTLKLAKRAQEAPELVVIDDLPWLHEQRAATLAHLVDGLLYKGTEVIVTALPSNDCLQSLQPDRVLLRASELLVTEPECLAVQADDDQEAQTRAARMWKQANTMFMGLVPAVCWSDEPSERAVQCLRAFFNESLHLDLLKFVLGMLFLGHGSVEDLERVGIKLSAEDAGMLLRDYPFLGMDVSLLDFKMPMLSTRRIREAVAGNELANQACSGAVPLAERVLGVLLDRGDMRRSSDVLEEFCTDEHCAAWLLERGWELLDQGQFDLVETLFARCPELPGSSDTALQALRAWACGLQGDELEAQHFARKVLGREVAGIEVPREDRVLAYLALAAFSDGGTALFGKPVFADAQAGVATPMDFLACVVDQCTEVELARALCADNSERGFELEKQREEAQGQRVGALMRLFTEHHERLWQSLPYRLALHLLQFVDSSSLRRLLQDLGCDLVLVARRNGLSHYSEALVVRDLWKNGYFGISGPSGSKRDALLLEGAARMIKSLSEQRDAGSPDVPWEVRTDPVQVGAKGKVELRFRNNVELMHIRLFGCFEVAVGERYLRETEFRRKGRVLLTILTVGQGRDISRETLLEQLWSDLPRTRALDNFYTVWSSLVATVGEGPYLEKTGDFCRINSRYVLSDVDEFERLSRQLLVAHNDTDALLDMYAHIESLYRGNLVPSEVGSQFVDSQRQRYMEMYVDAMVAASACALSLHDARLALWFARKAIDTDPRREDVYCTLIRAQMAAGQRCSAIRTYLQCQQFLRDELGLDPAMETKDLYERLISTDPSLLSLTPETFKL